MHLIDSCKYLQGYRVFGSALHAEAVLLNLLNLRSTDFVNLIDGVSIKQVAEGISYSLISLRVYRGQVVSCVL